MPAYFNLIDKIRRYFGFSQKERMWIILTVIALAFMVGFNDGRKELDIALWGINFAMVLIIVALSFIVHITAHRVYALHLGFQMEYQTVLYGLIGGLILTFLSLGKLFLLVFDTFELKMLRAHRLGYFRYGLNYFAVAAIASVGPIANLALASIFRIMAFLPDDFVKTAVLVNVLFAAYSLLPIPPLDGAQIFFGSRILYMFVVGLVLGWSVFLLVPEFNIFVTLLGALVLSLAFGVGMLLFEEKVIG